MKLANLSQCIIVIQVLPSNGYLMSFIEYQYACSNTPANKHLCCGESSSNNRMAKLVIREIVGDLFTVSKTYSLAHCVSADLCMSAGIALAFRNRFGQIEALKEQGAKTGGVAVLKCDTRYIYYLVTKTKYYNKPTYRDLLLSLYEMKKHIVRYEIKKLAIPRIGCGLDRLSWKKVKKYLCDVFGEIDLEICVYSL